MSFLPARMARLLVGGHNARLSAVIDALHAQGAVHIEDYDDPTGTTRIGSPLPAGSSASDLLVKVRGLLKALGAEDAVAAGGDDPAHVLAQAEQAATAIVERANQQRAAWVALDAEEAALAPYKDLDVDLSAGASVSSVKVFIGQSREDPAAVLQALGIPLEIQSAPAGRGFAVAAIVAARDAPAADKALAAAGFVSASLPGGRTGSPGARLQAIMAERSRLQAGLAASEADLANLRAEWGPRLASAEILLSAVVEKTQVPLKFGVTPTTFHIEGWVPRSEANRVKNALAAAFGDALYVEDLGDVPRREVAHAVQAEGHHDKKGEHAAEHGDHGKDADTEHHPVGPEDEPPIHLENPRPAKPYEFLLGLLGQPRYGEIDPTKLMLLWFPLFFGLMVGDLAVGLIIAAFGLWMRKNYVFGIGGPAVGRVLLMGGIAAAIVGLFVFGEALGMHFVTPPAEPGASADMSWEQVLGLHIPSTGFIHKTGMEEPFHESTGMSDLHPHTHVHLVVGGLTLGFYSKVHDIQALLVWSILFGIVHLNLGFALGVRNVYKAHGVKLAIQEKLAWVTLELGVVAAVWGLAGGPGWALPVGGGVSVASLALLWMGAAHVLGAGFVALLEVFGLVGNILSYTRLAAIGASKAGMVIAFTAIGFETLGHGNIHSVIGWIVYLLGFGLIIPLSILAGGLQSLRLQFVEFFQKFYTGGGRPYVPFGRRAP